MLTLFHAPKSRSGSIVWVLEELGVPYETKVSAADISVGGTVNFLMGFKLMNETPVFKA